MKRFSLFMIIGCVSTLQSLAQKFDYTHKPQWLDKPAKHSVHPGFSTASAITVVDDRKIEYKTEGKEFLQFSTYHKVYKINDDKGIEMFNKIFIPVYAKAEVMDLKARTILPNGKVIDVPANKINETEEDGRRYKIFAMEGVEKGAEVEYIYTIKRQPSFFGTEVFQNSSTPSQKAFFTLVIPPHLKFDAKGFNGFKISSDSLINETRVISGYNENIDEVEEEKYAVRDPYLQRVEYKLSYNISRSADTRIYTWKEFAKNAFSIYTTIGDKEEKPVASFASQVKMESSSSQEDKIRKIEEFVKSSINIDKNLIGDDASALDKIVKRKSADNQGIIKLFSALFEKAAINYQIVFVSKRDEAPLDEDFENWNIADDMVFYFPDTKKYMAPTVVELRYPYIPAYWTGIKGLFLKGTSLGTFKTAIGSFSKIDIIPFENHSQNMEVNLKFNKELDTLLISSKQMLTGYSAANYRPIYNYLTKDKQDEATLQIVKSVANSTDVTNIKVENTLFADLYENKPLTISADIKSTEIIERAGDKVLLKIGEIIGPQEQMYQEKPRQLPIELEYPHMLYRKIVFTVPPGYKVKNLKDLNLAIEHKDGSELTMGFTSTYKELQNVITIDVKEDYKRLTYPLAQFTEFKNVINAAADFNKIILVLEKIK